MTFSEIRKQFQDYRRTAPQARAESAKRMEFIKKNYAGQMLAEETAKEQAELAKQTTDKLAALEIAIDGKKEEMMARVKKHVQTPPTDDQERMLRTLSLRSKVSQRELEMAAEACGDNFQAMKLLADIAAKHKYRMPDPTVEDMLDRVTLAFDFLDYISANIENRNSSSVMMFADGDYRLPIDYDDLFRSIEADQYLEPPVIEPRKATEAEEKLLDHYFVTTFKDELAKAVPEAAAASPEMKTLIEISAKYSQYLPQPEQ